MSRATTNILIFLFFLLQIGFWWQFSKDIKPNLGIVPEVPSQANIKALSLGDEQFYFRVLATKIQTAGDTFGRSTPLKNYDYQKLYRWFSLLDTLDARANAVPATAAYYYANSQNRPDNRYVVQYLVEHSERMIEKKWWWMLQAVMVAKNRVQDEKLAQDIAAKLENVKTIPLWARQMRAFFLADEGNIEQSAKIVRTIVNDYDNLTEREKNFINYFLKERLKVVIPELEKKLQ